MLIIFSYTLILLLTVYIYEKRKSQTKDHFFVADRQVSGVYGSMSIAASWIWAPAIFVSTQVGYQWGFSGLVWFVVPNILALAVFGIIAAKLRQKLPNGYTFIEFAKLQKDQSFAKTKLILQFALQIFAFAIQVTAGAELVSMITHTPYEIVVLVMTIAPLLYSLISGLSSSIYTDAIQYLVISASILIIMLAFPEWKAIDNFKLQSFQPFDKTMLVNFGLASCLTLIFGTYADHQQWQRVFALRQQQIKQTYLTAGVLHGLVTLSLGTLGVVLALHGYTTETPQLIGIEFINTQMPAVFTIIFVFMALCGLCSTLDSSFCAFSSLFALEISTQEDKIRTARKAMLIIAGLGLIIAFSRISVISLWMAAGVIRLVSAFPVVWSAYSRSFSSQIATYAIIAGILIGTPLFAYGTFTGNNLTKTIGMLMCLLLSSLICLTFIFTKDIRFYKPVKN